jgi:hypothetical protein
VGLGVSVHRVGAEKGQRGGCNALSGNFRTWKGEVLDRIGTGSGVYVSLTRVKSADQPIENATVVAEEMLRWLRETEGFEGLLFLSREGATLGLTFWESRELAERHRAARMQFLDRMTTAADVQVEETVDYTVTFADLGSRITDFNK